jgi:hypothetical protein
VFRHTRRAHRAVFRCRDARPQSKSFARWDQSLLRLSAALLIVVDQFRCRSVTADSSYGEFARFKSTTRRTRCGELCVHFLDLRCLFVETRSELRKCRLEVLLLVRDRRFQFSDCRLLCLHLAVLFEKLVEQHRVHHLVAHAFQLAFIVAIHQSGVHFFHLLGDQAKSERLRRIKLLFKTEADRLKQVKRLTRRGKGFDVLLVTLRRNNSSMSKSAVAESDCDVIVNACAKILRQRVHIADPGGIAYPNYPKHIRADAEIAAARDVEAGVITVGRVGVAGEVNKRINTGGRVVAAVGVAKERLPTNGRVVVALGIMKQRSNAICRVNVAEKRERANGRVDDAGGIA